MLDDATLVRQFDLFGGFGQIAAGLRSARDDVATPQAGAALGLDPLAVLTG